MGAILSIKNRYWILIILPFLMFVTRYYLYFVLRAPMLEREGIENFITFKSFMIYNYCLGLGLMFLFLFTFFLLLKGVSFLWDDMDNKKLLKILLVSYCVFFIPDLFLDVFFTVFQPEYRVRELGALRRVFYMERETNPNDIGDNVWRMIFTSISYIDFVFFASIAILFQVLFKEISIKVILVICLILAAIYFSFKVGVPLLMM